MTNILRGIVVLLAVAAVLNAASFEEKLPSVEDAPSNLGEAASAELVDDSATDQKDFVEDSAAGVEAEDESVDEEMSEDAEENIPGAEDQEKGQDIPEDDDSIEEEANQDEEDVSLRSYSYRRCLRKVRYRRRVRVRVRVLVQTCRIRIGYRWITRNKYAYRWTYRWVWAWRYISVRYNRWKQVCCGGRVLWKRRNWCCYYNRYYKPCRKG